MSVFYTNQITNGSEDLNSVYQQSYHLPNKLLLNYDQPRSLWDTQKQSCRFTLQWTFPTSRLPVQYFSVAVCSASWALGALIYTAETETGFCAKHQVPPVTYLSVTKLHLPLTRGFCMFAWLPPSYHHTWFYETLSLCDTVLHVPCKHPVLSPKSSEDQCSDCIRNTDGANVKAVLWWRGK